MKFCITLSIILSIALEGVGQLSSYPIHAVPFTKVNISDHFWLPRLDAVQNVTIPYTFGQSEESGRVKNFEIAGGSAEGSFCTTYAFDDSDVYKIIEGAAYSIQVHPNEELENYVDGLIDKIEKAQEPDGYLYTWRTIYDKEKAAGKIKEPTQSQFHRGSDKRWERVDQHSHELYNLGHLYEAAIAYYQATGKRKLLDIAIKSADLVDANFGWGKIEKATGHQEIEIGLTKLYQLTGEKKYLELAKFFLDVRGYGDAYMQNHEKVIDQREIAGHAVRACYMYAAMADVTALTQNNDYVTSLHSIWNDLVGTKMYVTGGIGSSGSNEGFSGPYDLPNYSAYCETCASIAFVLWNHRMFQLEGDGKYVDIMERTLYNALNAGLSISGDRFFYPNPLESRKNVERSPWFSCACCPSNVSRFFPSIPGYIYAQKENEVFINLFISSSTQIENIDKYSNYAVISQETNYPWDGKVNIKVKSKSLSPILLKVRIPGWAKNEAVPTDLYSFSNFSDSKYTFNLNGKTIVPKIEKGYAIIERIWAEADVLEYEIPMSVQQVIANENISADKDRIAIQRGPLIYCLEGKDQPDDRILSVLVSNETLMESQFEPNLLEGIQTIKFQGNLVKSNTSKEEFELEKINLKAIPYYAWANRGKDNMLVWLPTDISATKPLMQPTLASKSTKSASEGLKGNIESVADQYEPKSSDDHENPFVHWWPKFGTKEWLQYDFENEEQIGTVRIYWFDDEASEGGCRIPNSWRVMYLENNEWKAAYAHEGFSIIKDGWSEVQFEPVKTNSIRIELQSQEGVSSGVLELEVK